ncbi:hypothetical protein G6K91_31545 [Agrobacterium rhizogenes]|uniref:Uncharacterized protein n=1 Tax=Rhizobium rhizogenes TaxID=359 RepID=A0A7S4ZTK9_RHIRH|nr:hypothetical protein [Rhizobium rhizogenes]NTF59451.1 hypothetical protein [Rhizobium rhizogenes]NTF79036.1 hypothetical protein [Rhizobium rhizogenes]NTG05008.1 hypothetical protein [Rhizobium rhizogenes]NTG38799.1 hypothetical protein [Rhizobium rhizogenes]NTG57962.1 hypothetical protein [Rhizobium rhizogenes]
METVTIDSRSDFLQWAIERARQIVSEVGTSLALAARDMDEKRIGEAGNALGQAIADSMIEVFDGLMTS